MVSVKQRAAVVILDGEKILLIHRISNGNEYYICPGGGVENNETVEEGAVREALEETGLNIKLGKKLWQYNNVEFNNRIENFFIVNEYSGQLKLGGPEFLRNSKDDFYELVWLNLDKLGEIKFFPEEIKKKIISRFLSYPSPF